MQTSQSNLVIIGLNTDNAKVYWKGQEITGITRAQITYDEDESRVKLNVSGDQDAIYAEMIVDGIIIKKAN